jgi:hypothetical protein
MELTIKTEQGMFGPKYFHAALQSDCLHETFGSVTFKTAKERAAFLVGFEFARKQMINFMGKFPVGDQTIVLKSIPPLKKSKK